MSHSFLLPPFPGPCPHPPAHLQFSTRLDLMRDGGVPLDRLLRPAALGLDPPPAGPPGSAGGAVAAQQGATTTTRSNSSSSASAAAYDRLTWAHGETPYAELLRSLPDHRGVMLEFWRSVPGGWVLGVPGGAVGGCGGGARWGDGVGRKLNRH